ncbi:calcium/proton exchanger (cax) [Rubidibacter lacunae KORDI 51-2]|uniref:Ca(2+)/H(+) antiporter n=1 Tax=Rubidibacter lacunae KORDI 51-2 TaxID=582515 RepID=U5DIH1_9CHRO|nr:calcium/proton exchanger [Rubidibacter lacunae]ERN41466.1 calcium/proton exchanger (cax) [Rubidibacter lacunae KORDI 51-2]
MSNKNKFFLIMLLFVPMSLAAEFLDWGAATVFILSALAIVPLAAFMGTATEEIAIVAGPTLGGLMNATFGNATELIIALLALRSGLVSVVKASITGSIVGNLLLVSGFAMLLGGIRFKEQVFQPEIARVNASAMNLAVIAILLPTALNLNSSGISELRLQRLSVAVSVVAIVVYGLTLFFSMKTHAYLHDVGKAQVDPEGDREPPEDVNLTLWIVVLLVVTVVVGVESEFLVTSLEEATATLGLSALFTGVILLPIIGNSAEHVTAVTVAMKNKMDLSVSVTVGSTLQIALFVGPILVIVGWIIGQPMDLNFSPFELVAVAVAVLIANSISSDGKSNWLEGCLLLATYATLALAFFFYPEVTGV